MKLIIKILQLLSPKAVSRIAYKFMNTPKKRELRKSEMQILNESSKEKIRYKDFEIQQYKWAKATGKVALLVHGWEGRAGNFAGLINVLIDIGYHVVAFDAPSHGESSFGNTNMFQFADFLELQFLKFNPNLIVSHSFGSVNTATVLRNNTSLNIELWIMVTTPHRFISRVNDISRQFGINTKTQKKLINRIQNDTNENIDKLDMAIYCNELTNVDKAIIVHSKTDKVLPIEGAREVSKFFEKSQLIELDGLGHYSILWSKKLYEIVAENTNANNAYKKYSN